VSRCEHHNFAASVAVGRLTNEAGAVTAYAADVKIHCTDCGRKFQFLGLPAGVNLQGATISVDGLEARLAVCPQGEVPSPLDHLAATVRLGTMQ
jgi:hypothetical protein